MSIPNDIIGSANVSYLGDPFEQYCGLNGKPLIGGHIEVYLAGTSDKYMTLQDFDGDYNPFKVPLGADGRVVMLADPSLTYDIYVYNSYNDLVCSRLNVECTCPGNISIKGADTWVRNTDGTLDISLRTSANNRRVFDVNTRNKRLDVQSPLYFVENSETATVIGFSGDDYATTADLADKMDISKLEYNEDGEISAYDGSAFAGQGGAGDPEVNELVHSNSAEWNDVSAKLDTTAFSTVSGNFLTAIPDNYATKDYVQSSVSSKLDTTAFSTVSGNFLTAHQSLDGLMSASLLGMSGSTITSYNNMPFPLGGGEGDAEVNQIVHANSADWNNVSAKLDTTAFSAVSGNFLTAHQSLADYLTKASADTLYQPAGDYATHDDLTAYQPIGDYAYTSALDSKVDTSSFTAFSSTTNEKIEYISGALSGSYELSAGSGINITDYPNEQKTVISVTAQGGNQEVENLVIANSATWDSVTGKADATALNDYATTAQLANKLDTTAFSTVSGNFITAHQDISDLMPKSESANFYPMTSNPSGFLTAHQDLSDYATTAQVADKLDTTAFSTVSGDFLTAVDLTPYQTTAGMTAYQEAGDYYSASNPSGFLTAVPAGTMNESNFGYDASNNITAYNGSAFNAGAGGLTVCAFSAISSDLGAFRNTIKDDPEQYAVSFTSGNNIRIAYFYTSGANARPDSVNPNITVYSDYYTYRIDDNTETSSFGINHSYKDYGGFTAQEVTIGGRSTDTVGAEVPEVVSAAADYVSATSADINSTINNVSANSGIWGGSALPISAGHGIDINVVDDTLVVSSTITGYVWQSATLFHTDSPVKQTSYTLSDNCSNYDKLEVDFYDINNWRTVMECPIPQNLASSGTRGGYFSVVPASTATGSNIWFKAFNWTAANTTWTCYCSELAGQGGSTTQTINANQPDNPPKVVQIIGWKRVEV